jgi:hypothetical protein
MAQPLMKTTPRFPVFSEEEERADLFSPVTVLPEQFFPPPAEADRGRGERALMRAVLEDALFYSRKYGNAKRPSQRRPAREAEEWFWAEDYSWPFSFLNICAALGLDADYIRMSLKRWRYQEPPSRLRRPYRAAPARSPLPLAA